MTHERYLFDLIDFRPAVPVRKLRTYYTQGEFNAAVEKFKAIEGANVSIETTTRVHVTPPRLNL